MSSAFLEGIGAAIGKIVTYIPGKVEKLRNEKTRLIKERGELENINMDINNPEHRKKAARLTVVIQRISDIDGLLGSKAKD